MESKVSITDNDIGLLLHHCDDAEEYLKQGKFEALAASIKDIRETSNKLAKKLSPKELKEF